MNVARCAGPVFRENYCQACPGEDRPLAVLSHTLVDGIVFRDDLVDHQFTGKMKREGIRREPNQAGEKQRMCQPGQFISRPLSLAHRAVLGRG